MKKYLFLIIAVAVYFPVASQKVNAQCGPEGLTPCCGNPARSCRIGEGILTVAASADITKRSNIVRQVRQRLEKQRILTRQQLQRGTVRVIKPVRNSAKSLVPQTLTLFPLAGFEPGAKQSTYFSLQLDNACGKLFEINDMEKCYVKDGIHFYFNQDGTSDHLFVSRFRPGGMPNEWRDYNFDWNLSYNDWMELFERLGYISRETKIPGPKTIAGVKYFEGQLTNEVETNYGKMEIVLDFSFGIGTSKPTERGTLFSISINRM